MLLVGDPGPASAPGFRITLVLNNSAARASTDAKSQRANNKMKAKADSFLINDILLENQSYAAQPIDSMGVWAYQYHDRWHFQPRNVSCTTLLEKG